MESRGDANITRRQFLQHDGGIQSLTPVAPVFLRDQQRMETEFEPLSDNLQREGFARILYSIDPGRLRFDDLFGESSCSILQLLLPI